MSLGETHYLSLRVGQQPERDTGHRGRRLDNPPALGDRGIQGGDDVLHPHEEGDERSTALKWADATGQGPIDPGVDIAVARQSTGGERPAEQLPEELTCRIRVGGPDLEVNNWIRLFACSCRFSVTVTS